MKNVPRFIYETSRPQVTLEQALTHCLERLFDDHEHENEEEVVAGLTFEELIGALLLCKNKLSE